MRIHFIKFSLLLMSYFNDSVTRSDRIAVVNNKLHSMCKGAVVSQLEAPFRHLFAQNNETLSTAGVRTEIRDWDLPNIRCCSCCRDVP